MHYRTAADLGPNRRRCRHHLVAGGSAGTAAVLILHPFDVVKTRLQGGSGHPSTTMDTGRARHHDAARGSRAGRSSSKATRLGGSDAPETAQPPPLCLSARLPAVQDGALGVLPAYRGPLDAVRQIARHEGLRAFYAGGRHPPAFARLLALARRAGQVASTAQARPRQRRLCTWGQHQGRPRRLAAPCVNPHALPAQAWRRLWWAAPLRGAPTSTSTRASRVRAGEGGGRARRAAHCAPPAAQQGRRSCCGGVPYSPRTHPAAPKPNPFSSSPGVFDQAHSGAARLSAAGRWPPQGSTCSGRRRSGWRQAGPC
jgi:hypothetical protein